MDGIYFLDVSGWGGLLLPFISSRRRFLSYSTFYYYLFGVLWNFGWLAGKRGGATTTTYPWSFLITANYVLFGGADGVNILFLFFGISVHHIISICSSS
ncbi:hypothetical protein EDC01DRAFT_276518 [Geopyxis carbonaria]|nr:hypothetical protein EDC01DRAFT_276518 [Geopyxis carbonaria]